MTNNEITLGEFKEVFNYLLDNNKILEDSGLRPIAVGLEGPCGIGKTSVIKSIAKERGMTLCTLVLSQLEEVGDLTGFPIKQYEVAWVENNEIKAKKWMNELQAKNLNIKCKLTGNVRMAYAPPAWLPTEENPNGTIILMDDFNRCSSMFMQAIMELINEAKYISWELPKYTNIVLSSNPDDGSYNISAPQDEAQLTRYVNFKTKLDIQEWAAWAETANVDGRAINFLLYSPEIFEKKNNVNIANPRSYTTFCKAISGLKDWHKAESLAMILQIAKGCFQKDTDNVIGSLFTAFVTNKIDKIVQPKEMLNLSWDTLEPKLKDCVYTNGKYRPEIASILTLRFINHVLHLFNQKGGIKESVVNDRILDIVNADEMLLSEDMIFHLVKTLVNKYPGRTSKLLMNAKIRAKVL